MAHKITRNITKVSDIKKLGINVTNECDLVSDGKNVYVRVGKEYRQIDNDSKADFTAQLAEKASKEEVSQDYAKKTEVNSLATAKADQTYVDSVNAGKADKTYVDAENTDLQTQINNLVLSAGDSSTEVLQARGGFATLLARMNDSDDKLLTYKRVLGASDTIAGTVPLAHGTYLINNKANIPQGTFPTGYNAALVGSIVSIRSSSQYIQFLSQDNNKNYWMRLHVNSKTPLVWRKITNDDYLLYKKQLTASDSIDDQKTEGDYLVTVTTSPGTYPTGIGTYAILSVRGTGNFLTQQITETKGAGQNSKSWMRTWQNSWSNWIEMTNIQSNTATIPSVWNNKKANFIGDSITFGSYGNYINTVSAILGLNTARNYGVGGSRLAYTGDSAIDDAYTPLVARYMNMDMDADAVFVLIGTNDYSSQVPLGASNSTENNTFNGALNIVLSGLRDMYPDNLIMVSTILPRYNEATLTIPLSAYNQAIKDRCYAQHILCVDLYATSGFDFTKGYYDKVLTSDGLHPNSKGAEILGRKIASAINAN